MRVYAGPGSEYRRGNRPKAARDILVDGSVIRAGQDVPREVPLRHVDALGSHGYVDRRPGDDGIDTG